MSDAELRAAQRAVELDAADALANARLQAIISRLGVARSLFSVEECWCVARAVEGFSQWMGGHLEPVYRETCFIRDKARRARDARVDAARCQQWLERRTPWTPGVLDRMLTMAEGRAVERRLFAPDLMTMAKECLANSESSSEAQLPPLGTPRAPWWRLRGGEQVANSYGYQANYTHAIAVRVRGGVLLVVARGPSYARCDWRGAPWVIIPTGELR